MGQKGLFPGIVLAEDEVARMVSPLYPKLWRMIREPFEDLAVRRASDPAFRILTEGETAQWLRPQIIECARQLFDGDPSVKVVKQNQQTFLRYENQFVIIPKKLKLKKRVTASLSAATTPTRTSLSGRSERGTDSLTCRDSLSGTSSSPR